MADALERKFTTCTVHVVIDDVNDHAPVFERAYRRVQLAEDSSIGHELVRMTATDDDDGDNALISYMLLSRTSLFTIDRHTGTVRVAAPLDRETTAAHTLQVMAIDHGTPAKRCVHAVHSVPHEHNVQFNEYTTH